MKVAGLGAGELLVTSMDGDGTQRGYDLALTREIADAVSVPVIASGGVSGLDDVAALARITGLGGLIVGKALYARAFTLRAALDVAGR